MKLLGILSNKRSARATERDFLDAEKRLVGIPVQADPPSSLGGYRRGKILKLSRNRMVLVECDGSWGTIWADLEVITALGEY